MIQSLNPATGQVLRRFDPLTPEAVQGKLEIAAKTSRSYPMESLEHRRFWMRRLALLLESDLEELASLVVAEVGKTLPSARAEVEKCASVCRYYAEHAERILEIEPIATEHAQSFVRWDPLGVVLAIMPWNFPLWQVFRFLAPALMAGNVALLKHAPNVPQCALEIEALVRRAGFPRGSLQTLLIEAEDVEAVLGDERVSAVTITGSEAAGRAVAAQAGYLLKKSLLELGGSDPFLVLPSADLAAAISNAVQARCLNNGQSCIAAKRFIVHQDIYEEFERGFVQGMRAVRVGDPMAKGTAMGPLATEEAAIKLLRQVNDAVAAGGRLLTGGKRLPGAGFFFEPTVIAGVSRTSSLYTEEIFGPVALLFRAETTDEALRIANETPFGLGASCWTTDVREQQRLAREIEAGSVFFNTPVASDPRLPFGGIKRSGYGRELSAAGMREFMNTKTVVVAEAKDSPQQTDLDFPPDTAAASVQTANGTLPPPEPLPGRAPLAPAKDKQEAETSAEQPETESKRASVLGLGRQ